MVEWLAGNRIRGTTAERPNLALPSGSVGGWVEVARTTLGSTGNTIDVTSLPDKRYYMILGDYNRTAGSITRVNYNNDTGSNYSYRRNMNGGSDGTTISNGNIETSGVDGSPMFTVGYIANKSNKEKLMQQHQVTRESTGASSDPFRYELVGKWTNTSDAITSIKSTASANSYNSGSEVVVLGWDTADTHTTNFWEELADVTLSSASSELSSGTITAKKYLWIQCWSKRTGANDMRFRFNNDSGSNYANRKSSDGGTDATITSATSNSYLTLSGARPSFLNMFVVNNTSNEKLCIYHVVHNGTSGAGTATNRQEWVGKWTNTSDQITEIDISPDGGNLDTGSILKVWGSD